MGTDNPITQLENVVIVNSIDDLPTPEVIMGENVITLEGGNVYEFGAVQIDLEDNHIIVPQGVKLLGQDKDKTKLISGITSGVLFSCIGDGSGSFVMKDINVEMNSDTAQMFELSTLGEVLIDGCIIFTLGDLGNVTNVNTFRVNNISAFVAFNNGLEFYGMNGTVIFDRCGLVNVGPSPAPACIVFAENSTYENIIQITGGIAFGTAGTYALWIDHTCTFSGGEESVTFALEKFMFGIGGLGGVSPDSLFFKSRLCFMQRDTHTFGSLYFHNPIQTTFLAVDTPVKAEGQTTDRLSRGWNHAYNQLSYLLTNPLKCSVEVKAYLTAEASVTNASIYIAKNGVIDPDSRCQVFIPAEGAIAVTDGIYDVDAGDYFEIWVENNANTWSISQWVQLEDKATRMKITTM